MQLRIFTEPQQGASYEQLLAVARATEAHGFDGFFRSDHYLSMGGDGLPGRPTRGSPGGARGPDRADPARDADDLRRPSGRPGRWRSRSPRWTR